MHHYDTDEWWNSDYDSTWEDEEPLKKKQKQQNERHFFNRAARDMQHYRNGYGKPVLDTANNQQYEESMPNLEFYQNKIAFQPYGVTIEKFHQDWREDYIELEENHSFIQWLFPLQEHGVNRYATPLTLTEIEMMKKDEDVMKRFLESYKIMLGFYGIQLGNEETGEVKRAKNWRERFGNLNNRTHNNLRITRILKCLGEMGYDHFQAPLVRFFLEETLCNNQLPNVERSVLDYFMFAVKDKQARRMLVHFTWMNYKSRGPFIWGPVEKLHNFTPNKENDNEEKANEEIAKEPDEAAGGGDVASKENTSFLTMWPHHHDLQHLQLYKETGTGEGLEEVGDDGEPGVDSLGENENGNVVIDVCSGEAAEHEDVRTSSRDDTQTTEGNSSRIKKKQIRDDNSSGKEALITEDNSSGKEELITEHNSSGKEELRTEHNSSGKEELITEDNSSGKEELITEHNSSGKEELRTEHNSSGKEELRTEHNSSGKEELRTEHNSSGKEELRTEHNSSGNEKEMTEATSTENEKQIKDDNSSGKEELITEDNSSGKEELRTEHNSSWVEKQIRDDNSSGKEELITEDNSSGKEEMRTEHNSSGKEELRTEQDSSGKEELRTEDNSSGNDKQITEATSTKNEMQTTEDNNTGNEQTTESASFSNHNQTPDGANLANEKTEAISFENENTTTGDIRQEIATLVTQAKKNGPHQPESLENEEKHKLLSGIAYKKDRNMTENGSCWNCWHCWDYMWDCIRDCVLSLNGFCCYICYCTEHDNCPACRETVETSV